MDKDVKEVVQGIQGMLGIIQAQKNKNKQEEYDLTAIEKFLTTFAKVGLNKNIVFDCGQYKLFAKSSGVEYSHEVWGYDGDIPDEWNEFKMKHFIVLQKDEKEFEIDIELCSRDDFYGKQNGPVIVGSVWNVGKRQGYRLSNESIGLVLDVLSGSERENEKIEEIVGKIKLADSNIDKNFRYFEEL